MGRLLDQHHTGLRQVEVGRQQLYGKTTGQHHTGLRQVEVGGQQLYGKTTGPTSHWVEAG